MYYWQNETDNISLLFVSHPPQRLDNHPHNSTENASIEFLETVEWILR